MEICPRLTYAVARFRSLTGTVWRRSTPPTSPNTYGAKTGPGRSHIGPDLPAGARTSTSRPAQHGVQLGEQAHNVGDLAARDGNLQCRPGPWTSPRDVPPTHI